MKILGIETSCDETAAAVVQDGTKILSNITATSAGIHARTGGIIPEDAARKQIQAIIHVIELALIEANTKPADIDAIAVTVGPGLIGSLLVGVETAKTLSLLWNKPLIPVNHLLGHIYANWLNKTKKQQPQFPLLALVVSGGHTDLVYMKGHDHLEWLGGTRDDAAGEAFDKTARMLGFDYPGGPLLSKAAEEYKDKQNLNLFPRPLLDQKNYDWSFSGLKTAVLRELKTLLGEKENVKLGDYKRISEMSVIKKNRNHLAAEIQEAIVEVLVAKTMNAVAELKPASLLLGGGVAANSRLKEKLLTEFKTKKATASLHVPEPKLCTDNAAVIGCVAFYHQTPIIWQNITANPQLTITSDIIA